jgi:phage protein, HK97 gp10 family
MAKKSRISGLGELERAFERLGKVPQTVATKSARAGATIVQKAAKANAPEDTGKLKRGIVLKRERSKVKGKTVYDVLPDPGMNNEFVKTSKDGKRSYYPASQEYGFLTVDGRYIPGYRYMRRAADDNVHVVEEKILEVTGKEIDKALNKR